MRTVLSVLVLPLLLAAQATASWQDEAQALSAFNKAFKRSTAKAPDDQRRTQVLEALVSHDSPRVAKALIKAYTTIQEEVLQIEAERTANAEQTSLLLKGQEHKLKRTFKPGQLDAYKELQKKARLLRKAVDKKRELLIELGSAVAARRDAESVSWLLENVATAKKYPLSLKVRVTRAAGAVGPPALPALLTALKKSKVDAEMAALLTGIGYMGKDAVSSSAEVISLLTHKSGMVREHAALALSTLCDPDAIVPMIDLLARSVGQSKKRIAAYLEALTRQQHGTSAPTWRRWFRAEGAKYLSGAMPLGGGEPSSRRATNAKNYYFGIPQDGKSIVYVIDSSGSMRREIQLRLPHSDPNGSGDGSGTKAKMRKKKGQSGGNAQKTTRLEACKAELIRALGRLEPTTRFNVIWYSELPHLYKPLMLEAKKAEVREAQDWVRKLQPNSSTNIHDSMHMAFGLTGLLSGGKKGKRGPLTGKQKKVREASPDTIFLLSDGSPTLPPGDKPDSTEKIINAVREWNSLKSVVVHCIGIGKGVNVPFMRQLAQENGGEFKQD